MPKLLGLVFSARPGGNLYDLAQHLFANVSAKLPDVSADLIEIARQNVNPCNGCRYDCLFGQGPSAQCPIEDDVMSLWRAALQSDLLIYFIPTYGGMPPATWVAFQQRYHGVFRHLPESARNPRGKTAALTVYDPMGIKTGDVSQQVIIHSLAAQSRPFVRLEQIIPANYGLNSLRGRLIEDAGIQGRLAAMSDRIVQELQVS